MTEVPSLREAGPRPFLRATASPFLRASAPAWTPAKEGLGSAGLRVEAAPLSPHAVSWQGPGAPPLAPWLHDIPWLYDEAGHYYDEPREMVRGGSGRRSARARSRRV